MKHEAILAGDEWPSRDPRVDVDFDVRVRTESGAIDAQILNLSSDGFLIDAELYLRAKKAGLSRTQVGVRHRPRTLGSTTVRASTVTQTLRALWNLSRSA